MLCSPRAQSHGMGGRGHEARPEVGIQGEDKGASGEASGKKPPGAEAARAGSENSACLPLRPRKAQGLLSAC